MKTSTSALLIAVACALLINSTPSFATGRSPSPRTRAISAVHHDFPMAQTINWRETGKEIIASFTVEDDRVRAFYDLRGNLTSTFITSPASHLPFQIERKIAEDYPGFVAQTMTEAISKKGDYYYVMMKHQSAHMIEWMRIKSDRDGRCVIIRQLSQPA